MEIREHTAAKQRAALLPERWNRDGSRLLFFPSADPPIATAPDSPTGSDTAATLALIYGRLAELSGKEPAALLTLAARWIALAQHSGATAAWILAGPTPLYPPDLADAGVSLADLVIVRLPFSSAVPRAAELLLRSGGVRLAVLDFLAEQPSDRAFMNRLAAIVRTHDSSALFLTATPSDAPSLGPLVSLRLNARLQRRSQGGFLLTATVLKDKRGALQRTFSEVYRGPLGLR